MSGLVVKGLGAFRARALPQFQVTMRKCTMFLSLTIMQSHQSRELSSIVSPKIIRGVCPLTNAAAPRLEFRGLDPPSSGESSSHAHNEGPGTRSFRGRLMLTVPTNLRSQFRDSC